MCVYLPSALTMEVNARQARLPNNNRTSLLLRSFIFVRPPGFRLSLSVQKLHNGNKKNNFEKSSQEQREKRRGLRSDGQRCSEQEAGQLDVKCAE